MPASDLFTNGQFASYLKEDVDNASTDVVRTMASGWLMWATGLSTWTVPVPDQIFSWALELAAIAYRNPDGLTSESIDDYSANWDARRRKDILDAARVAYGTGGQPLYAFPDVDWHWTAVPVPNILLN